MEPFARRLLGLETRLEWLIEENFTRVFPNSDPRKVVSREIADAIRANLVSSETGESIAPDLYILVLDPGTFRSIDDGSAFSQQFSAVISQAGTETGIQFRGIPRVKITANPGITAGGFGVVARFSLSESEGTSAVRIKNGDVNQVPEFAFVILDGNHIYPLTLQVVNIGRRADNHLVIEDRKVSRLHAQVRVIRGRYVIFDLNSSGGTFVNGSRVSQSTLSAGDVISLAGFELVYGEDAVYASEEKEGSTQPLIPNPEPKE